MATPAELFEQARVVQRSGQLREAGRLYVQLISVDPSFASAWRELGLISYHFAYLDDAQRALRQAIRLDGASAESHHGLGATCLALGNLADAQASFERALQLQPNHRTAPGLLWQTLKAQGRTAQADEALARALAVQPITPDDHCLRATLLLATGRWEEGWREHEHRYDLPDVADARLPPGTRWHGEPLAGRTLLVHAEGGFGDVFQWIRYVPKLRAMGGEVLLTVHPKLAPLVSQSVMTPCGMPWPPFDVHLGMFSLPLVCKATPKNVPTAPYLAARPDLIARWGTRLSEFDGLRVGINWQGNTNFLYTRQRGVMLQAFAPLASVPSVRLFNLQKGPGSEQLAAVRETWQIVDWSDETDQEAGAFMDTAAIMKNLDLVITTDTAIAHLAGGLGVPVWTALSALPEWRWMYDRDDSPWYPSMRLFRQRQLGQWDEVFARMASELAGLAAQKRPK